MTLIGPCMFVAPIAAVLAILALPLWPVAIVLLAILWVLVAGLERVTTKLGIGVMTGWTKKVGHWLHFSLKPWHYFDPPWKRGVKP